MVNLKNIYHINIDIEDETVDDPRMKYFNERTVHFLEKTRDHLSTIRVGFNRRRLISANAITKVFACAHNHMHDKAFPLVPPRKGDLILMKKYYSAFEQTNLADILPKDAVVLISGMVSTGSSNPKDFQCINSTIADGLEHGFQMMAIPDLTLPRYTPIEYEGFGKIPTVQSHQILAGIEHDLQNT